MQGFYVQQLASDLHRWAIDVPVYQMKEANAAWQSQNTKSLFQGGGYCVHCLCCYFVKVDSLAEFELLIKFIHTVDWTRLPSVVR